MTDTTAAHALPSPDPVPPAIVRDSAWRRLLESRLAILGLIVVALVVVLALLAPLLPLPDPAAIDIVHKLLPPGSAGHWLGTDNLGRDLLSRVIWGARISLLAGAVATVVSAVVGSLIGLVTGTFHGLVDHGLMRIIDIIMAFPYLLLAIALIAVLGPGLSKAMIAVAVVNIPFFARAVRGATLGVVSNEYVEAALLCGRSRLSTLFMEILPNVFSTILITMSTTLGWMIIETAGLSFLGLGAQPPASDWGSMLADGRDLLSFAPHVSLVPGLAIFIVVISLNFLGDGLRDALDPKLS